MTDEAPHAELETLQARVRDRGSLTVRDWERHDDLFQRLDPAGWNKRHDGRPNRIPPSSVSPGLLF